MLDPGRWLYRGDMMKTSQQLCERQVKGRVGGCGLWQVLTQLGGHPFDLYLRLGKVSAHSLWFWPYL